MKTQVHGLSADCGCEHDSWGKDQVGRVVATVVSHHRMLRLGVFPRACLAFGAGAPTVLGFFRVVIGCSSFLVVTLH